MAQQGYLEFVQLTSGKIQIRKTNKNVNPEEVDFEVVLTAAQWITLITGVGADGLHAGVANTPVYTPILESGGSLSPVVNA